MAKTSEWLPHRKYVSRRPLSLLLTFSCVFFFDDSPHFFSVHAALHLFTVYSLLVVLFQLRKRLDNMAIEIWDEWNLRSQTSFVNFTKVRLRLPRGLFILWVLYQISVESVLHLSKLNLSTSKTLKLLNIPCGQYETCFDAAL